jgi:hypothetical protein
MGFGAVKILADDIIPTAQAPTHSDGSYKDLIES